MNKILLLLYVVSVLAVMLGFYGMNSFTETIGEDGSGGGNGNPALIIPVFIMPFFFYFLYGTVELSMRFAESYKNKNAIFISLVISGVAVVSIGIYTFLKAEAMRMEILLKKDNLEYISQVSLLNTFSNSIFFNPLTFILVVLLCYIAGALWSMRRKRKNKEHLIQKVGN